MSHIVWRIATDTPDYEADDLAGKGAEQSGGRWNERGVPLVYASETRALACLETIVHLNAGGLPFNRYLVTIEFGRKRCCRLGSGAGRANQHRLWDGLGTSRHVSGFDRAVGHRARGIQHTGQSTSRGQQTDRGKEGPTLVV